MDEVNPWRDQFRVEVGRCEMCLVPHSPEALDVHELTTGSCRKLALDKPYACMCLCRPCHNIMELLVIPNQLAYLHRAAPDRWDLEAYYKLTKRRWPELAHIMQYREKL